MRIERRFTKPGQSAYAEIEFRKATSEIKNPDGSIVFRLADIDVPAQFSQVAADILAQKYFRKAGVPSRLKKVEENSVPSFLWRQVADEAAQQRQAEPDDVVIVALDALDERPAKAVHRERPRDVQRLAGRDIGVHLGVADLGEMHRG